MSVSQAEFENQITSAGIEVYLTADEPFAGVQNTWYSPSNIAVTGDLAYLFEYSNGHIVYTGTQDLAVMFEGLVSLTAGSSDTQLEVALGKNGSVNDCSIQESSTKQANVSREVSVRKVFNLVTGTSLDFYIRQTSSSSNVAITLQRGLWTITKAMVFAEGV